tara:strand:- start:239 stop:2308 length:2070 start_codon:yes stop_codon:yes gene_type:complete
MKKNIILTILILFVINLNFAQIDRTKQPESGPDPEIKFGTPKTFKLKNGIQVLVVEDDKLPVVTYSLRIDRNPIIDGEKVGVSTLLSAMLGNGTTNIPKDEFNEEVEFLGASVSVTFSGGSANTLTKNNSRVLELWSDAIINPLLTEEEFDKEKAKLLESLKADINNIDAISSRVSSALSYGKNHPYGEFTTEQTIDNVTFEDVIEYHKKYNIPNNAYIVVVGDVKAKELKAVLKEKFEPWKKGKLPVNPEPLYTDNVGLTEINFIDVPSATQSTVIFTNNTPLKQTDDDYFAALLANQVLGGGSEGYLFKNLRDDNGWTYGSYSGLGSNRYGVSRFTAEAKVRNSVTDSTVTEIVKEISRIRTENVDPQRLKDVKAAYLGNFIFSTERASTVANFALGQKLNNLPDDYYETFIENINKVTAQDLKKAANKYFKLGNTRIIVVGRGSEVVAGLEEIGFPINYFDKFANPIAKPIFNKEIPEGLTALDVINKYLNVVGGRTNLESVKTLVMRADVSIPGAPFVPKAIMRQKFPNKYSQKIEADMQGQTMTLTKTTFNGERGYTEMQGQRIEFDEKQIEDSKNIKGLFDELYYSADQLELVSINSVNYQDAYKVKVTVDGNESHRYYSVETGFLLSSEETDDNNNVITTNYGDYQSVDNIMFPFFMELPGQKLEFKTTSVIFNKELKDSSF